MQLVMRHIVNRALWIEATCVGSQDSGRRGLRLELVDLARDEQLRASFFVRVVLTRRQVGQSISCSISLWGRIDLESLT